jgi:hypothetical protein
MGCISQKKFLQTKHNTANFNQKIGNSETKGQGYVVLETFYSYSIFLVRGVLPNKAYCLN